MKEKTFRHGLFVALILIVCLSLSAVSAADMDDAISDDSDMILSSNDDVTISDLSESTDGETVDLDSSNGDYVDDSISDDNTLESAPLKDGETNIYVSKTGSDSNDGLTEETAVATISKAYELASDGSTINIGAGVYDQASVINIGKSLTFVGVEGTILNRTGSNSIFTSSGNSNLVLQNIEFTGVEAEDYILYFSGTGTNTLNNCTLNGITCAEGTNLIYLSNSHTHLNDCSFTNLIVKEYGTIVAIDGSSNVSFTNCAFEDITLYNGILVSLYDGPIIQIFNCNFTDISGNYPYGFIYGYYNCIVNISQSNFKNFTNFEDESQIPIIIGMDEEIECNVEYCNFIECGENLISGYGSNIMANYNYWGTNENPSNLVQNAELSNWVLMSVSAEDDSVPLSGSMQIIADFSKYTDGNTVSDLTGSMAQIPIEFANADGTVGSLSDVVYQDNKAIVTYTGLALGDDTVTITVGNEQVEIPISVIVPGATIYVNPEGNDENDGLSKANAVKTIARAIEIAKSSELDNLTVKIANGEYNEGILSLPTDKSIDFIGAEKGSVIIKSNATDASSTLFFKDDGNSSFSFKNLILSGSSAIGGSGNVDIADCTFKDINANSIFEFNTIGEVNIAKSIFFDNTVKTLIQVGKGTVTISYSAFYDNKASEGANLVYINATSDFEKNVIANFNWWGSNDDPNSAMADASVDNWVIMNVNPTDEQDLYVNNKLTVDVDFNHYTNGTTIGELADNIPEMNIVVSVENGTIDKTEAVTENGKASFFYILTVDANDTIGINGLVEIPIVSYGVYDGPLYVSPDGNDENIGSSNAPLATIFKAISLSEDNSTIYLLPGIHTLSGTIYMSKSLTFVGFEGTVINRTYSIFFQNTGNYNLVLQNIVFDGSGSTATLLDLRGLNNNTIINCTFTNMNGGKFLNTFSSTVIDFIDCTFEDMMCSSNGFSIASSSKVNFNNCTFSNIDGSGASDVINIRSSSQVNFTDCVFKDSLIESGSLRFIYTETGCVCNINNCNFTNISGTLYGLISDSNITYCIFANCTSSYNGGDLIRNSITDNCIFDNIGTAEEVSRFTLIYNSVINNSQISNSNISGLIVGSDIESDTFVINTSFINNTIKSNSNDGCFIKNIYSDYYPDRTSNITIEGCSFINNKAKNAVILVANNYVNVAYSIFLNNTNVEDGSPILVISNPHDEFDDEEDLYVVNANYNWYGTNEDPSALVDGVTLTNWIIMNVVADTDSAAPGVALPITVDFKHYIDADGAIHELEGSLAQELDVIFESETGTLDFNELTTVDQVATAAYTGDVGANTIAVKSADAIVNIAFNLYGPGNVTVKHTDAGDAADIQAAIDSAEPGNVIQLGNYNYTNVSNVNITKDLTITSDGASITSSGDGTPIFNVPSKSENGPDSVSIIGINFVANNGDVLIKAIATNGTDDLSIVNPAIEIANNTVTKANDNVVASSITLFELESERGVLAPSNPIDIKDNDVVNGAKTFDFEIAGLNDGSGINIPQGGSINTNGTTPVKVATTIVAKAMTTTTVLTKINGKNAGKNFSITLKDSKGNVLANKQVMISLNGKIYKRTTNANGVATVKIALSKKGTYPVVISFLGDEKYNGSFVVTKVKVNPQKVKLTVTKKTYKASKKTKYLYATLKATNKKAIKGKKLVFTVNGKKYTAKTNAKGIAKVKVKLSKKKTYKVTVKFAGDSTFNKITKKGKVVIK